jgi:hypothetical protein
MRYLILCTTILFFSGCTDTPTPQEEKEVLAQAAIQENMSEAKKARSEYLALQEKRRKEGAL